MAKSNWKVYGLWEEVGPAYEFVREDEGAVYYKASGFTEALVAIQEPLDNNLCLIKSGKNFYYLAKCYIPPGEPFSIAKSNLESVFGREEKEIGKKVLIEIGLL